MDRSLGVFVWGPIAIGIWRGECDAASVKRLESAAMQALHHSPAAAGLIGIIEPTAPPPSAEMRKASAASNDRMAEHGLVGIAGVFARSGFAGSIARGVITGLSLLSRARYPFKVFETHVEGARWLAELIEKKSKHFDAVECARAVGQFRLQYENFWTAHYGPVSGSSRLGA
ncbi:MAG TPA: hypothetical protein VG963_32515 [Polyangiaceae bacterium]|nr:hypothetical protein [Polyangiaceae bacterium]